MSEGEEWRAENNLIKQVIDFMQEESKIEKYKNDIRDLPLWLKYVLAIFAIVGTGSAVFAAWIGYGTLTSETPVQVVINSENNNTLNTANISDLFLKALALDTVLERQDFLAKYVGDLVYGKGKIKQVSRYGNKLLVDFDINNQTIICPQDEDVKTKNNFCY